MKPLVRQPVVARFRGPRPPWTDRLPVREELFGVERLEQHARSLAVAQAVTKQPPRVPSLHARLDDNADALLAAYRDSALELEHGRAAVPAAEWLLDNYHLVEEQVREARLDLPPGFYRQLPKLENGPFAGYPRVFGIAWAYVAHTDSHFDADVLARFLVAYQTVQPLTIGELWAIAITLRIVLLENLRRLADQITSARDERDAADAFADRLLGPGDQRTTLAADPRSKADEPLTDIFAAQLVKRLRGQDPETTPALAWLSRRLEAQRSSIDLIVQHDHQRQAVANVTVRNVITSMRLMSDIGWADLFERVSLVDERLRRSGTFAAMDFASRNLYRDAIEELGRGSPYSEIEIATRALSAGRTAATKTGDPIEAQRVADPGYHLVGHGREAFEHVLRFVPPLGLRIQRWTIGGGIGGYVTSVLLVTAGVIALASMWFDQALPHTTILAALALIALIPFTDVATALVNRSIALNVGARPLPGLELLEGVPAALRTLIVVPTLLTSRAELREQIEHLEVHHLSGAGGEVYLALLTDWADADRELVDGDLALLAFAIDEMAKLNARHAAGEVGPRFLLLHRRRVHSAGQDAWMGRERKRGKLQELNRLLRGATDTTFMTIGNEPPWVPTGVRYVLTLDADTRLPRDTATRLIGKMAHPLNRPRFDADRQRVVDGYAILQPRVTPSLPLGRDGSVYQRIFAGPSGIDPYASAASDVYQDLLGEGSFTGKGIYDVDAFEAALAGRVPAETLLSHDLFEGSFARAGLASDVEVIDEFPSRYDVDAKRQHRWVRGDWQLLPWIWGHRDGPTGMPMVGRWKMLDNLRRSMIAPTTLAAFGLSALLPGAIARECLALLLMVLVTPIAIHTVAALWSRPKRVSLRNHLSTALDELKLSGLQLVLMLVLLPDRAWRSCDAIVRTLVRVLVTRRHLLEWTTAAQSARGRRPGVVDFYRLMAGGTLLVLLYAIAALVLDPKSATIVVPLAAVWLASPAFAWWVSRPLPASRDVALDDDDALKLRLIARRTWRFFETFVTPADHMLPPDNFQEVPRPTLARRTSPTNIGLYLLSTVAARDFGWAGTGATVERIEATLASMRQLAKHRGHFFNWYDTGDQRVLEPPYVSAVDSGNLAGHLIVLANACEAWRGAPVAPLAHEGVRDTLRMARDALRTSIETDHAKPVSTALDTIEQSLVAGVPFADLIDAPRPAGRARRGIALRLDVARRGRGRARPRVVDRRDADGDRRARGRSGGRGGHAGRAPRRDRARGPRRRDGDGLRVPARRRTQAVVDRLFAGRQPPRPELLRPARIRSAARQPLRDREGRRADEPLVPARSRRHAGGLRLGADLVVGLDVRVPDAVARHARAVRQPARADQPPRRRTPALVRGVAGRAVGRLGIRVQRARHRLHVPVLQLRRPRPRLQARPRRQPRHRAVRDRPRDDGRSACGAAQLRRARDARRARSLRLLRRARLHALARARRRTRRGGPQLHGASRRHDDRRDRERAARRHDAVALPCRADDRRQRTAAAGAHSARHLGERGARRGAEADRRRVRGRRLGRAPAAGFHRRCAGHAPAVERPLQRDADDVGFRLQPLGRPRDHALARGRDARRGRVVRLPSGRSQRAGLGGDRAALARPAGRRRRDVRRGRRDVHAPRRSSADDDGGRGVRRGRRGGPARVAAQPRPSCARDRVDVVRRTGPDDAVDRQRASGVREDVRADALRARVRRADRHASSTDAGRARGLGRALRRRRGPHARAAAVRDRPDALRRSWRPSGQHGGDARRRAAVEHGRHGARPGVRAALPRRGAAGRDRQGLVLGPSSRRPRTR